MAHFEYSSVIAASPDKLFEYYTEFSNLPQIMPQSYKVELTGPIRKKTPGSEIDLKVSKLGVYVPMELVVEENIPSKMFKVRQSQGPFSLWVHTMKFEDHGKGCLLREIVEYDLPYGIFGKLLEDLLVTRELESVFEFRHRRLGEVLAQKTPKAK